MATSATIRKHHGCCECGRMKHTDGTPHGRPVEPDDLRSVLGQQARQGVSHGYCSECRAKVWVRYGLTA